MLSNSSPFLIMPKYKTPLYVSTLIFLMVLVCLTGCSPNKQQEKQEVRAKPIPQTKDYTVQSKVNKHKHTLYKGIIPNRLHIPILKIDAPVDPVGFLENGQMDVPKDTERVGWLKAGVLPGAVGNAVMDGHVDTYTGPAVFFNLKKLKPGDHIYLSDASGNKICFGVKSVNDYLKDEAPIDKIFGPSNEASLNLITCAGRYTRSKHQHEGRLVVYATRMYSYKTPAKIKPQGEQ